MLRVAAGSAGPSTGQVTDVDLPTRTETGAASICPCLAVLQLVTMPDSTGHPCLQQPGHFDKDEQMSWRVLAILKKDGVVEVGVWVGRVE